MARSRARIRQSGTPRESDNVTSSEILLSASDGYPLAARLWKPAHSTRPVATALINSGAGISFRYYDHFASYLANNGIAIIVASVDRGLYRCGVSLHPSKIGEARTVPQGSSG